MAFTIELSHRAFDDIDSIVDRIQADSPSDAARWRSRLFEKLETLQLFPRACSLAPENGHCDFEVRQTIFGNYRILFTVDDDRSQVSILSIRWAARRFMSTLDLNEAASDISAESEDE